MFPTPLQGGELMDTQQIEAALAEVKEFEKSHPGTKYGIDFGLIAQGLYSAASFKSATAAATLAGLVNGMMMPKRESLERLSGDEAREILEESLLREPLAAMFYAGYKFALALREAEILERHAKEGR